MSVSALSSGKGSSGKGDNGKGKHKDGRAPAAKSNHLKGPSLPIGSTKRSAGCVPKNPVSN